MAGVLFRCRLKIPAARCNWLFKKPAADPRHPYASVSVSEDGKKIKLLCDGSGEVERRYHGVWLRHNCRCPQCLCSDTNQNVVPYENLVDLKLESAQVQGDNVHVEWTSQTGPHSCSFSVEWLKKHDYTSPSVHNKRRKREEPLTAKSIPESDYREAVASKEGYYKWMKQVNDYGLTLMKNIPTIDRQLVKFCEEIAQPQAQPFLPVFEVRSVPNASSKAYTSDRLILHTDQNFLENTLGIQFFHCLRFDESITGGESTILDTYPVIEELRRKHPKHFEVLSRVPYIAGLQHSSLDKQNVSVDFSYSSPHIRVDSSGRPISVSWSQQLHYPLFASEEDVEAYYEAFIVLSSMFETSPHKIVYRLRPGEAFITNNRRVLHGRNSFTDSGQGGERHLQGFYLSIDYFRSRLAVLAKELNKDEPIRHFFHNSYFA